MVWTRASRPRSSNTHEGRSSPSSAQARPSSPLAASSWVATITGGSGSAAHPGTGLDADAEPPERARAVGRPVGANRRARTGGRMDGALRPVAADPTGTPRTADRDRGRRSRRRGRWPRPGRRLVRTAGRPRVWKSWSTGARRPRCSNSIRVTRGRRRACAARTLPAKAGAADFAQRQAVDRADQVPLSQPGPVWAVGVEGMLVPHVPDRAAGVVLARPPSSRWASCSTTRAPPSAAAIAAHNPARPPPTTVI